MFLASTESENLIELSAEDDDSREFVEQVEAIISGVCRSHAPKEFIVVRIDNWFGKKWLQFSGKIFGLAGVQKSRLTIPPFVPNRVRWQRRYVRGADEGCYALDGTGPRLHQRQTSHKNLVRFVDQIVPETGLMWFSGQSKGNDHGAVMAYVPIPDGYWTWYVSYAKKEGWRIEEIKGISRPELDHILAAVPGAPSPSQDLP